MTGLQRRWQGHVVSSFHVACSRGDVEAVTRLLDEDASLIAAEAPAADDSNCGLHYASAYGNGDVVKVLLKRGACLDKVNDQGWSALMQACYAGHRHVVTILLQAQANVHVVNKLNCTALLLAAHRGDEAIVSALIEAGAHFHPTPPPAAAARSGGGGGGGDTSHLRFNPLLAACVQGNVAVVYCLLGSFHTDEAVNVRDSYNNQTALALSAAFNNTQLVDLLLHHGADPDALDTNNRTPFDMAVLCKSKQCRAILRDKTANIATSCSAAADQFGSIDPPIIELTKQGNVKAVRELVEMEPSAVEATTGEDGGTVLMLACVYGHLPIVKLLVAHGADVDRQDLLSGWTSLMQATYHNRLEIVRYLVDSADASLSVLSHNGITAFDIASLVDNIHSEILNILASRLHSSARGGGGGGGGGGGHPLPHSHTENELSRSPGPRGSTHLGAASSSPHLYQDVSSAMREKARSPNRRPRRRRSIVAPSLSPRSDENSRVGVSGPRSWWSRMTARLRKNPEFSSKISVLSSEFSRGTEAARASSRGGGDDAGSIKHNGWVSAEGSVAANAHLRDLPPQPGAMLSSPSAYTMSVEPNHLLIDKQLAPVVPPFCPQPDIVPLTCASHILRHKPNFSFSSDFHNTTGMGASEVVNAAPNMTKVFKPVKRIPPRFLTPKTGTRNFDASEHSSHVSPHSSYDFSRSTSTRRAEVESSFKVSDGGYSQHEEASPARPGDSSLDNSGRHLPVSEEDVAAGAGAGGEAATDKYSPSSPPIRAPGQQMRTKAVKPRGQMSGVSVGAVSEDRHSIANELPPPAAVSELDMSDLLAQLSLVKYKHIFDEQEVDAEVLLNLTEGDLEELGIEHTASKRHILRAISTFNRSPHG